MLDLSWTGNYFLDDDFSKSIIAAEVQGVSFSRKGPSDAEPLRRAIAEFHTLDPEWVAIGAGSSQVLDCLLRLNRDRKIVDVIPNFKMARLCAQRDKADYLSVPVCHPSALYARLRSMGLPASSIVVFASPRNPFGDCFPLSETRRLLEEFDGPVIIDEAYVDFAGKSTIPFVREFPHLIVVRTFSKAWGLANMRIGYCVGQSIGKAFRDQYLLPYNIGELSQRAACALLRNPAVVIESVQELRAARARFLNRLRKLKSIYVWPSGANYVCFEHVESDRIKRLLEQSANIRVARLHGLPGFPLNWPDGLRITVPEALVQDRIIETIEQIVMQRISAEGDR